MLPQEHAAQGGRLGIPGNQSSRRREAEPRSPSEFDYLTEDEIDRLLEGCGSPQLRAIVTVAVLTGLRRGEIFGLEWRDVRFDKGENGLITVRKPKNDDTGYMPMNQAVREALSGYPKRIEAASCVPGYSLAPQEPW